MKIRVLHLHDTIWQDCKLYFRELAMINLVNNLLRGSSDKQTIEYKFYLAYLLHEIHRHGTKCLVVRS